MIAASLLLLVLLSLLPSSEAWTIQRTAPGLGRTFQRPIGSCVASATRRNALMTDDTKRCSLDIREMLPPDQWVRSVLQSLTPASLEEIKDDNRASSCLINSVNLTMSHDFIDVDGTFSKNIKEIERALEADPDSRDKPLLATVKGSGGGKTRLFEEFRRYFKEREDTVAIGVTFNNKTPYELNETFIQADDFLSLNLVLSVMTRIGMVISDNDLEDVEDVFHRSIKYLDSAGMMNPRRLAKLFRSFLNVVIEFLAERDPKRQLKNLVLLMDETIRPLEERLREEDVTAEKKVIILRQFSSFLSAINQGVLDERLGGATGRNWNTALLISSLDVSPVKKTLSGREITLLPTGVLSSERVVDDWWRKSVLIESSVVATAKLRLLAEVLKTVPRFVQIARDFLVKQAANSSTSGPLKIDAALVRPLFERVLKAIDGRYSVPQNISPQKLFGLIYGRKVDLDEESAYLMRTSFFTNTLDKIREKEIVPQFVPQGNLAMLAYYDQDRLKSSPNKTISEAEIEWNDPDRIFLNVYRAVINSTVDKGSEGDALEKAALGWMMARLIAAQQVGIKEMPLHEFFAVAENRLAQGPINVKIPAEIDLNHKVFEGKALSDLRPISENHADFAQNFNKIQLPNGTDVMVFSTGKGQNFDQMIVFRNASTGKLFVTINDEKCKQVTVYLNNTNPTSTTVKRLNVTQFDCVQKFVEELRALENNGIELSEISRALVEGNYCFVYFTTHPELELQRNGEKLERQPDRLAVMTANDSKNFFGILWDLYRAARGLYDAAVFEKRKKLTE